MPSPVFWTVKNWDILSVDDDDDNDNDDNDNNDSDDSNDNRKNKTSFEHPESSKYWTT